MLQALDPEAVAAFLRTADLASFTRAAEALGTTQSLVSTRIRRLEDRLGKMLLQRHPRLVRLTPEGERFVPAARELMAAHGKAASVFETAPERMAIGISEQAVGAEIPTLLARLASSHPDVLLTLRIEPSRALEAAFERGELDVVIIRRLTPGRTGEVLREDGFGWFAAERLPRRPGEPLPLISLMPDCWLRQHGMAALDLAGLAWREAFIGGGMAAVLAAIAGGLGIAPLATRLAPPGTVEIGRDWGLPELGSSCVVMRSQLATPRARALLRELAAAFRAG